MRLARSLRILGFAVLSLFLTVPAQASLPAYLRGLRSVDILIEALDKDAQDLGITHEMLMNQTFVALKSKAPVLKYDNTAEPYLYVHLTMLSQGYSFAAILSLELYRPVDLRIGEDHIGQAPSTHAFALASVWENGALLTGPRDEASTQVREELDTLLESFFADYYRANP